MRLDHPSRNAVAKAARPWPASAAERRHLDELLDEGLKQTFPASDAVAIVQQPPERSLSKRPRRPRVPSIAGAADDKAGD